jgi:DNA-binding NarL/FixJ family response regulator
VEAFVVIVADPAPLFRSSLRAVLERDGATVREARDLRELLAWRELGGDVAVVSLDLPPGGALAAVEALREAGGPPCVVWALEPVGLDVLAVVEAGATGVVRKDTATSQLVRVVRTAAAGATALDPDLGTPLASALHQRAARERARRRASVLSARERTVLELAAAGGRNREIANVLGLSEFTVKRHIQNILRKLDVPSRQAAGALFRLATAGDERRCVA